MFCLSKSSGSTCQEKDSLTKLSSAVLLVGGAMAIAYYGWQLAEKLMCECHKKERCDCGCTYPDPPLDYDHFSENDCLSHDAKDYYGHCGCFDDADGHSDGTIEEETK